ncbi:hypothetical protein B1987_13660 [Mycobacterium kansasii]|nr:hypothetical protein B1987_13660 [Mycobacterium kansasii]
MARVILGIERGKPAWVENHVYTAIRQTHGARAYNPRPALRGVGHAAFSPAHRLGHIDGDDQSYSGCIVDVTG